MIDKRAAGFRVEETDRSVVYRLPANLIGWARWGALGVVGLGVCFLFCGSFGIASPWLNAQPGQPRGSGDLWELFMSLPFVAMGLWMVVSSLWVMFGRDEVVLDERFLTAIIRIGPFRWRRRVRRQRVSRFTVVARGRGRGTPGSSLVTEECAILRAELDRGKSLTLARLHSHDLLRSLADTLSRRSALIAVESDDGFGDAVAKVKVAEDTEDPQDIRERPVQPARSDAILERFDDGLKITIPREGLSLLWGPSRGWLMATAIFFPAGIFLAVSLWDAAIKGEPIGDEPGGLWLLFPIPFLAMGIGLVLWIIHAIVRTTQITLRDGTLTIDRRGLFGHKIETFMVDRARSIAVRVHKTDTDSGPSWSNDLGIDSTSAGWLSYRRKDELEWIATTLRDAARLGRPEGPGEPSPG